MQGRRGRCKLASTLLVYLKIKKDIIKHKISKNKKDIVKNKNKII
jgi:hypothetical protein